MRDSRPEPRGARPDRFDDPARRGWPRAAVGGPPGSRPRPAASMLGLGHNIERSPGMETIPPHRYRQRQKGKVHDSTGDGHSGRFKSEEGSPIETGTGT